VGVQDTFGHIGTPKLVLALVIFAVLKYSVIRCISVKVVDSVAPKLLLILGCDFFGVGVQDTFGHIGTPKLVLALVIFAVLKYSVIPCISVKVVDSVAPKLLLILGYDFFPTKLGLSAIWSLVIRLYTIKRQFQAMHNLKSESSVPIHTHKQK
jgi:hypothetical protein